MKQCEIDYMRQVIVDSKHTMLPTVSFQLESLKRFMSAVGYKPVDNGGHNFVLKDKSLPYPQYLNWRDATRLHNYGVFIRGQDQYEVAVPMRFYNASSAHILDNEWKVKLVQFVYLQWSKRKKCWVTTKDQVKFVNPEEPCLKESLT